MNASAFTRRCVISIQRRGNIGKSTFLALLSQYLVQRTVPWRGYDLDPDHRSFSRLFAENVTLHELVPEEPEAEIIKIVRGSPEWIVGLIDPRAHISDSVLRAWEMVRFPAQFANAGGRITVALFPGDDLEILTDIDSVVARLHDTVDYLVVRNPARQPRTRMFDGSALESDLRELGAASVEMPTLLALARNHLAALEAELGRGVTHLEAVANRELPLDGMVRLVIEDWLRTAFSRFDAVAEKLLPSPYFERIAKVDVGAGSNCPRITRGAKINKSNL